MTKTNPSLRIRPTFALLFSLLVSASLVSCLATPPPPSLGASREDWSALHLVVIAHGTGSSPTSWPTALATSLAERSASLDYWSVQAIDWRHASERPLLAARRGYALGSEYARRIASDAPPLERRPPTRIVHLVAHSMGAHFIQGIADGLRAIESRQPALGRFVIHMTFLDAFHPRGLLSWRWGIRTFGRGADFAESFVTRDEPAFLTNALLPNTFSFDVTATVPDHENPSSSHFHNWPPAYYIRELTSDEMLIPLLRFGDRIVPVSELNRAYDSARERYPPGGVRIVDQY